MMKMSVQLKYPVLYKTSDVRGDTIVRQAVDTAISDALELWKPELFDGPFPIKGFGIAKLRAKELLKTVATQNGAIYTGFWGFSVNTASTWETMVDVTLSDSCYIVITGIFCYDANPDVELIKITADGVEYPVMDITEMYGWDEAIAYMSHPVVVRPEKQLKIKWKAPTAGQKKIGFLGYVVAKRSYLINEY
jgi:hypothetical protein